ncbi:hypothetical protein SNEBB_009688 [Seison nebaliae]|nr:hypothetical protein SNEBB_009688 [Seison nebaliae]
MALLEFFGCLLTIWTFPVMFFILIIAKDSVNVVMMMTACFFFALSQLFSSLISKAIVPLQHVIPFNIFVSVLFQEIFRLILYVILRRAELGVSKLRQNGFLLDIKINARRNSVNCGMGFGIMSAILLSTNMLSAITGPGTFGIKDFKQSSVGKDPKDTGLNNDFFSLQQSIQSLLIIILNILWTMIAWNSIQTKHATYSNRSNFIIQKMSGVIIAFLSHLFVSYSTLFHQYDRSIYISSGVIFSIFLFNIIGMLIISYIYIKRSIQSTTNAQINLNVNNIHGNDNISVSVNNELIT